MDSLKFVTIIVILASTAANGASLLNEEARNLANPGPLLKRCPCVPINTCYAQGVSLNEQDFLNTHFECPDYTQNHCCGPYFPTLGSSEDFYFDDVGAQGKFIPGFSKTGEPVMIVMAQNVTAEPKTTTPRVMTVLPETTTTVMETTTMTEVEDSSTTTEDVQTTTEAVTDEPTTTTEAAITTTTTTVKPKKLRLPKTHTRRVLPRFERRSTTTTTTTEPATTSSSSSSTSTTETQRRSLPTRRRTLYRSEFRQRLVGSRVRSTSTTTAATDVE